MNDILNTRLFSLLAEPSQEVTNEEMQNAYVDFVKQVETLGQSETDYSAILNSFHILSRNKHSNPIYILSPSRKTWGLLVWRKLLSACIYQARF
jgi:hypothetical protein